MLKQIPSEGIDLFVKSTCLLPHEEIEKPRDLAELWHWRSRTRQLVESGHPLNPDQKMKAAGFDTLEDIVRFTANRCKEDGRFEITDEDFAVHGIAYRDLTDEEWSEVRSITMERHIALNWLCGYAPNNQWDETPIDT